MGKIKNTILGIGISIPLALTLIGVKNKEEQAEKVEMIEKLEKETKNNICSIIDCKNIKSKKDLLVELGKIKTDKKVFKNIVEITRKKINSYEKLTKSDLTYFIILIGEIKKLEQIYEIFQNEALTSETNITISNTFNNIIPNQITEGKSISGFAEAILRGHLKKDFELLNDNYFFDDTSVRDLVEKNIRFGEKYYSTNFESKQIEEFLNLFTIEYINKVGRNNFINGIPNKIKLNKNDIFDILVKVSGKQKNKKLKGKIFIKLDGTEYEFTQNYKEYNEKYFSEDETIREIQKNYGINHKTKTKKNEKGEIIYGVQSDRITPFLTKTIKGKTQKMYETNEKVKEGLKNNELIDLKNEKRDYDIKDDIITSGETIATYEVKYFLDRISKKFLQETDYKFQITCLNRTEKRNKEIGGSPNSSHLYANGIDFSFARVIDKKGNVKSVQKNSYEMKILENILKEEDKNGNIVLIEENDHFHVGILSNFYTMKNSKGSFLSEEHMKKEDKEKISTSEFIEKRGIDITTETIIQDIFTKAQIDFASFTKEEQEKIFKNTKILLNYITYIESSGGYFLENIESSAKGPFQILHGYKNGERIENYKGENNFSTFEVWLRKYIKYSNNVEIPTKDLPLTPDFVEKALNSNGKIGPNELTQTQNINLFLVGTFLGDSEKDAEKFVKTTFLGNFEEMEKIYEKHHSNPDEATKKRMLEAKSIFKNKLEK